MRPVLLAHEGEPVGSGFRAPETPSKAAVPREPWAAQPRIALGRAQVRGENRLRCFPEPRRLGVVVCCPRRVSLCRMQLPEARFGLPLRQDVDAERPSWLRGHGWGLGAEGFARPILLPHEGEPVGSGFRAPETPSKAAGPRELGQTSPGSPYGFRGPGAKKACVAFSIRGALGLWFAARGEFPFAECS